MVSFPLRYVVKLTRSLSDSNFQGQVTRAQEAEENYVIDQAGVSGGATAVQHGQREPRESTGYHQRTAAAEGKH